MSKRDDRVSLKDMLSHAREAVELLGDASREELGRQANPEIPWPQIIGMRNRLAHGYDVIDFDLLWDTVTNDLPPLIESLRKIVAEFRQS